MFQHLLQKAQINISTIRSVIETNEKLRTIAFEKRTLNKQDLPEDRQLLIDALIQNLPELNEWRVYDHCAVVTRLYAIYERFVEDLITDWIQRLPDLFPIYSDLEERIRETHRIGVGRLLIDLTKDRYQHLSIEGVVQGLFCGVTAGAEKYQLIPDAFLFHEQNLRKQVLEKLFADAGIKNAWGWVEKHRDIKKIVDKNTAEGELNKLISYRNDAAHGGDIDEILGTNLLLELCDFMEILCKALAELITYQIIERQKLIGQAMEIGRITEWFPIPKAAVAKIEENISLSVGMDVFLVGEAYCQLAKIISIQIDDLSTEKVDTICGMEVGLKFNIDTRKELRIYLIL